MRILMLCLGNICRSPLAEEIMRTKLSQYGISGEVDSAGILSFHEGSLPHQGSINVAKLKGLDISNQRSRPITKFDYQKFDYILAMDDSVMVHAMDLAPNEEAKLRVYNFLQFSGSEFEYDVRDPYRHSDDVFLEVYETIEAACERIAVKLKNNI